MLSIGQFSKLSGLSQKTLIWYDNIGLLKPDYVNEENGYRYYRVESIEKVADIHFWQTLEFSINDIKNLNDNVIEDKIEQLRTKIMNIERNISLLENFKEENMNNFKVRTNAFRTLVCGKWRYKGDYTSLNQILKNKEEKEINLNMPKYLFFSNDGAATDLVNSFYYRENSFSNLKDIEYNFFLLEDGDKMVVYYNDKNKKDKTAIKLHLYEKNLIDKNYTEQDLNTLLNKYRKDLEKPLFKLNENLLGNWIIYDTIKESEIENYTGLEPKRKTSYILPHLYEILDIKNEENDYVSYIMKEESALTLVFSDKSEKTFTRENTKVKLIESNLSENTFYIVKSVSGDIILCNYKKIGDEEYIFADLQNSPDLDVELYVFKKQK